MKAVLILMRIILTPLTKSALTLFQASAAMSAADKAILKKIHGSGTIASIMSN